MVCYRMSKGQLWLLILFCSALFFDFAYGKALYPVHTIDKACAVGFNSANMNMKKTFEIWSGATIPVDSLPGDTKLFTGFKVHRVFYFHQLYKRSGKALKITYCNEGKVVFETEKQLTNYVKDWNQPWCFFESKEQENPNNSLKNFHCLKMARRKKYAIRPFDVFIPYTWVGGLFYCDVDMDAKQTIFQSLQSDGISTSNAMEFCSLSNSIPIQPLYASTYSDSWSEVMAKKLIPFITLLSKRKTKTYVPYLQTPNLSMAPTNFSLSSYYMNTSMSQIPDFKSKLSTKELLIDWYSRRKSSKELSWFQEIEVSERYHYDKEDNFKLTLATEKLKDIISPLLQLSTIEQDKLSLPWRTLNKVATTKLWKTLSITDKIMAANLTRVLEKCSVFLNYWDNMHVSDELFEYVHP